MRKLRRRCILAAALSLTAAAGGLLVTGTAQAQKVTSGSLSFSGDSGDYISQGKSYSYSTGNGDALTVSSASGSTVSISVNAYNGDWWTLTFDAPGTQVLTPRTYTAAHRHPFNGTGPGLDLSGEGRGCNELTGSFTVTKAVFGPNGYVQSFDATFEQHCEGGDPAARGKVHIANQPAPPEAAPKPTKTSSKHASTSRPRASTSKRAATASPRATPTGSPSAAASASPVASGADASGADPGGTDANTAATPNLVRKAIGVPLLLMGAGFVALVALAAVSLMVVGLVLHVRGR